jgi:hypothetical protein
MIRRRERGGGGGRKMKDNLEIPNNSKTINNFLAQITEKCKNTNN